MVCSLVVERPLKVESGPPQNFHVIILETKRDIHYFFFFFYLPVSVSVVVSSSFLLIAFLIFHSLSTAVVVSVSHMTREIPVVGFIPC